MHKLLRRCLSGPPILSANTPLSFPTPSSTSTSLSLCDAATATAKPMSSSTTALRYPNPFHRLRTPFSSAAAQSLRLVSMPPSASRSSAFSIANGGSTTPFRASVVSIESSVAPPHRALFSTSADNSDICGGEVLPEKKVVSDEETMKRVQRRQRSTAAAVVVNPDLLKIPGVGPRNLQKLVEKGYEEVAQLKKLYKDKFFGKSSEKMVEFLRSSVGIIHKNHAESITTFIKESVDEELKNDDTRPAQKKRVTLCVEGNISVGKTTFLQRIANETLELRDLAEIVPEPIEKWQNVGPDHFNILDAYYAEPERYAYTFQNYVFFTRYLQERESSGGVKPLRLMERSVFTDRMVFVRAVQEAKYMNEMEISIYDSWFDPFVSNLPELIPDGFIYLRASPGTCHKRMMMRKRTEEVGVSLDYLQALHEKHESWLFPFQSGNHGVLSASKLPNDVDWSLHPNIRNRVFYLDGDHLHPSIKKIPALVLDCEPDIDFSKDIEAKREYACQVAEFFEFVKTKKSQLLDAGNTTLPDSALKSLDLDFTRAMSMMRR